MGKNTNTDEEIGQFATAMNDALKEKKMSMQDVADALDITYEHTRKICHSMAFPGKHTLKPLCRLLGLDLDEMHRLVVSDKIEHKYGGLPYELAGKSEKFKTLERLLPKLTDEQFNTVLGMIEGMVRRN